MVGHYPNSEGGTEIYQNAQEEEGEEAEELPQETYDDVEDETESEVGGDVS
jgi:hypothetical protein